MDMTGNLGMLEHLEDNMNIPNLWGFDQDNNRFQTTISSSVQVGGEVEEAVKRAVQTITPTLVEEAVLKGIQASIPALVEEVLQKGMQALMPSMVEEMRKMIGTFLPMLQTCNLPSPPRTLLHVAESHASRRSLRLHFESQSPSYRRIFTGKKLKEQGILFKLALRDDSENIVEVGAESSIKIRIVVLQGDFSLEDEGDLTGKGIHEHVLQPREGKPPLLVGKCDLTLRKGVADIDDIMFTDNSSWVRSGTFKLGVEVLKSVSRGMIIRETTSEPFEVKERRGETYQKKGTPELHDEVWRLHNIARNGNIHRRLEAAKINSVNDLLQLYHANVESLKKILLVSDKKLKDIVEQATSANSNVNQPGYDTGANEGKVALPLTYENPNEQFKICGLNYHSSSLSSDTSMPASGFPVTNLDEVLPVQAPNHGLDSLVYYPENDSAFYPLYQDEFWLNTEIATEPPCLMAAGVFGDNNPSLAFNMPQQISGHRLDSPMNFQNHGSMVSSEYTDVLKMEKTPVTIPLQEERSNVTRKLISVFYMTKAATMFMISVQQDASVPKKKRKLQ